jgi:CheY-like chemotaxis protein/MinD-like ATPase involved in chromosome partitioning or flagellar assembly
MAEKILIVDDDRDTLRLVGLLLQRKGYEIIAAERGSQGLEKAFQETPDLILLDVMMPDMDGFEVLRQVRGNPATSGIPVIMFTAKTQVDDKVAGFEAGADDYLTKPTHPSELTARVKALLTRTAQRKSTSDAAPDQTGRERGTVVGVLSAKGGLGVTTVATNLAFTFQKNHGGNVVLSDFRPGNGNLSLSLGYKNQISMSKLLTKEAREISISDVQSALQVFDSGVRVLLSSYMPSESKLMDAADQFSAIVRHLSYLGKYVVLDLGSSLAPSVQKVIDLCSQLIIVTEPVESSITQTKALLDELSMQILGLGNIHVVLVNRIRSEAHMSTRSVQDKLGRPVSAMISPAPELAASAGTQNAPMIAIQKEGLINQQYDKLAQLFTK